MDIGPGTGDSLLAARKLGASRTMCVDSNPYFVKIALLRGHQAYLKDYTFRRSAFTSHGKFFPCEVAGVDFIWSKGAINCEYVNQGTKIGAHWLKNQIKGFCFRAWVIEMKSLLNKGGQILFMPAVNRKTEQIVDEDYPIVTNYWVDDVDEWDTSYYAKILLNEGFTFVKNIAKYNHPQAFPTAFLYQKMN